MPRFYGEGDTMCLGYGSNFCSAQLIAKVTQLSGSWLNSDDENVSVKKMKLGEEVRSPTWSEASSCLDEEFSCATSSGSRVSVPPKSIVPSKLEKEMQKQKKEALKALEKAKKSVVVKDNLRAAMMKYRFADTILRAQKKQGVLKSVDVVRYKLDAKAEFRREVQKQRLAARAL